MGFSALGLISPWCCPALPHHIPAWSHTLVHSLRNCICSGRSLHMDAFSTWDIQTQTPDLKPSARSQNSPGFSKVAWCIHYVLHAHLSGQHTASSALCICSKACTFTLTRRN